MDALTKGTWDGLQLLFNIVAILIVFVSLVKLANIGLGLLPELYGAPLTLERILGILMAPVVWLIGVPWEEARTAGAQGNPRHPRPIRDRPGLGEKDPRRRGL